jgi:hypothetical protein
MRETCVAIREAYLNMAIIILDTSASSLGLRGLTAVRAILIDGNLLTHESLRRTEC